MELTQEDLMEGATSARRPISGQSLVEDPSTPSPYTRPPKFTNKEEAIDFFIEIFLEPSRYQAIMDSLEEGTPVMELVQLFLMKSFKEGDVNPDMMLLLAEPLAFVIMGLAERAGVKFEIVGKDEDDPEDDDDGEVIENEVDIDFSALDDPFGDKLKTITSPQDDKDFSIETKLDNIPSLMAKGEK
tara:strand:- start:96 stop:653 length:558 start_codon:yes stop_codon:yes gene_type:complete